MQPEARYVGAPLGAAISTTTESLADGGLGGVQSPPAPIAPPEPVAPPELVAPPAPPGPIAPPAPPEALVPPPQPAGMLPPFAPPALALAPLAPPAPMLPPPALVPPASIAVVESPASFDGEQAAHSVNRAVAPNPWRNCTKRFVATARRLSLKLRVEGSRGRGF